MMYYISYSLSLSRKINKYKEEREYKILEL